MSAPLSSPTLSVDPDTRSGDPLALRFHRASTIFVIVAAALASVVLGGAYFGFTSVPLLAAALSTLKAGTAMALLLAAASVWLCRMKSQAELRVTALRISVAGAAIMALASMIEHMTGWNVNPGQWLVPGGHDGPMAVTTAFSLLSLLGAVVLAGRPGRRGAQTLTGLALLIALFDGVGFIFGLRPTVAPGTFGVMALPTSLCLLLLSLGLLFSRPAEGAMDAVIDTGPGGIIVRRLLPLLIVVPVLLAWLSWYGVQAGFYTPPFAISLLVTLTMSTLSLAVLSGGRILRSFEEKRLLAEAARVQTEGRLRRAVTDAPIPIVIHDGNQILNMSRAWAGVSGYDPAETPTVSSWVARAQPEFVQRMPEYLDRLAAATETILGGEQPVHTGGGERRIWDFSSTPLGQHGTDEKMFVTMAVDVTARKQAEAELRGLNEGLEQRIAERTTELTRVNDALKRQSDQLREQALLLDLVRDGILVRDLYGTVVYWSAGATEMYGFDRTEALGRMSHQLLSSEYPVALREIEETVTRTGFWEGEVGHTTRTGTRLLVESRWTLTRTERGIPEGFMEVHRDITARKRAQDSLRDSELRFRAVAETAIEGIISLDAGGTIRYWNPGAERLFGRPAAEAVGLPVATVMPEPFLAQRQQDADRALGTTFEAAGRRRDNSEFPLEISLVDWTNTQGTRYFTAIVRDVTGRKEAERALQAKAEELARSNQELEQFAYVASHDLQEPLRMVSNYTQLLARRYKDELDSEAHEFIGFAVDGAKRMQELIHDLLQYARVGTRGKEFRPVPGARIVAEAMSNLASTIDESRAQVVVDPLPTLFCDGSQLVQVFQNLIGNAVKFRRESQSPVIRVSAARTGRAWNLSVQDNGIGIEPRHFDRIFQMFQRLHGRGEYAGTGIGLALCKKIVERHSGRIRVESEPDRGTTFSFTIPDTTPPASGWPE